MATTATADDFDESTPPPRTRPQGDPVPAHVVLPPGESLVGVFHAWDRQGRIPEGSVLCRFVGVFHAWDRQGRIPEGSVLCRFVGVPSVEIPGTDGKEFARDRGHSGYVVEVLDTHARTPLGRVGAVIPTAKIEAYRVAVTVRATGHGLFAVLSPLAGGRS